jgi:hypothetical protein
VAVFAVAAFAFSAFFLQLFLCGWQAQPVPVILFLEKLNTKLNVRYVSTFIISSRSSGGSGPQGMRITFYV